MTRKRTFSLSFKLHKHNSELSTNYAVFTFQKKGRYLIGGTFAACNVIFRSGTSVAQNWFFQLRGGRWRTIDGSIREGWNAWYYWSLIYGWWPAKNGVQHIQTENASISSREWEMRWNMHACRWERNYNAPMRACNRRMSMLTRLNALMRTSNLPRGHANDDRRATGYNHISWGSRTWLFR